MSKKEEKIYPDICMVIVDSDNECAKEKILFCDKENALKCYDELIEHYINSHDIEKGMSYKNICLNIHGSFASFSYTDNHNNTYTYDIRIETWGYNPERKDYQYKGCTL